MEMFAARSSLNQRTTFSPAPPRESRSWLPEHMMSRVNRARRWKYLRTTRVYALKSTIDAISSASPANTTTSYLWAARSSQSNCGSEVQVRDEKTPHQAFQVGIPSRTAWPWCPTRTEVTCGRNTSRSSNPAKLSLARTFLHVFPFKRRQHQWLLPAETPGGQGNDRHKRAMPAADRQA